MSETRVSYSSEDKHLHGIVHLPSSKSISNRILMMRALCDEKFVIHNLSESTDTQVLLHALNSMQDANETQTIDVQDAGTSFRFLTAYLACQADKNFILKGTERMHQRPIGPLVNALRDLGAEINYMENEGFPPLSIIGKNLHGGNIIVEGNISSQFISALCLVAPALQDGLTIEIQNDTVSLSYIEMTLWLMSEFGVKDTYRGNKICIKTQKYTHKEFTVENDWSSACFFYAMAMIAKRAELVFDFLDEKSIQGDSYVKDFASDVGVETKMKDNFTFIKKEKDKHHDIEKIIDLGSCPDMAIPMIVACAIRYPKMRFAGIEHLKYKESDRIHALQAELEKVNIILNYEYGLLSIDNTNYQPSSTEINFNTHNDHRIAMSLCLLALEGFTVVLDNDTCVQKSFPHYFEELRKIGFEVV